MRPETRDDEDEGMIEGGWQEEAAADEEAMPPREAKAKKGAEKRARKEAHKEAHKGGAAS